MKSILLAVIFSLFAMLTYAPSSFAAGEIQVTDFETGVGLGCYGRCGYLSVSFKIKNIDYHKKVGILFRGNDGEWRELEAYYVRPLEDGFEEWKISTNFSERGGNVEFVGKYEVKGAVYWDNNYDRNFTGSFL